MNYEQLVRAHCLLWHSVMAASRIISTCPLQRAGFPDGRTCEDCFCGAKPRRDWALPAQPFAAPKQATLPRQGLSFIRTVLQDPQYRVKTLQRLRAGRLAPSLERYLWRLAFGKLDEMEASVRPRDFRISFMNEAEDPLKRPAAGAGRCAGPEGRGLWSSCSRTR